jgi:hypothetical protein
MSATTAPAKIPSTGSVDERSFLLERVQPALSGLMDGSLSTLAPIFATLTQLAQPRAEGQATIQGSALPGPTPRRRTRMSSRSQVRLVPAVKAG